MPSTSKWPNTSCMPPSKGPWTKLGYDSLELFPYWLQSSWRDYNHSEFTMTIVGMVTLFVEGCCHLTMTLMLPMTTLDTLRSWSSDRVFKFVGKSVNFYFFHLIEHYTSVKIKLVFKREFYQENACKWYKILLQKWFINLTTINIYNINK